MVKAGGKNGIAERWKIIPKPWIMLKQTWHNFSFFCEEIKGISYFQLPFASSLYLKLELSQLMDTLGEGKCGLGF